MNFLLGFVNSFPACAVPLCLHGQHPHQKSGGLQHDDRYSKRAPDEHRKGGAGTVGASPLFRCAAPPRVHLPHWDIPVGDTQEVISLLDRELDAIHAAGKNGTVTHVLPEEELPINASGLETLDNIWDLFETSLRVDSPYARTKLFEMAKWLEESQILLDWIEKTPAEKQAWKEQVS